MTHDRETARRYIETLIDTEWQGLLDKDDRTSPIDYPDMCLISKYELTMMVLNAMIEVIGLKDGVP